MQVEQCRRGLIDGRCLWGCRRSLPVAMPLVIIELAPFARLLQPVAMQKASAQRVTVAHAELSKGTGMLDASWPELA